jgi:glucose-6-phosphate isomerase
MPPGWAHYVANVDPNSKLVFGAWCDRQYGFDYTQMRAHRGLAWFPLIESDGSLTWERNPSYAPSNLHRRQAREYPELGLSSALPIYKHLHRNPESIQWVSDPARLENLWAQFEP